MRRDHVRIRKSVVTLKFLGKGGTETEVAVEDGELAQTIRALLRRSDSNEELLGYRSGREWIDVRSADINDYLREISGGDITAKDFRTWHGTVAATVSLCAAGECATRTARKRAVAQAMRDAAAILGNTPAVARASYVDPRLIDAFTAGGLDARTRLDDPAVAYADPALWRQAERITTQALGS